MDDVQQWHDELDRMKGSMDRPALPFNASRFHMSLVHGVVAPFTLSIFLTQKFHSHPISLLLQLNHSCELSRSRSLLTFLLAWLLSLSLPLSFTHSLFRLRPVLSLPPFDHLALAFHLCAGVDALAPAPPFTYSTNLLSPFNTSRFHMSLVHGVVAPFTLSIFLTQKFRSHPISLLLQLNHSCELSRSRSLLTFLLAWLLSLSPPLSFTHSLFRLRPVLSLPPFDHLALAFHLCAGVGALAPAPPFTYSTNLLSPAPNYYLLPLSMNSFINLPACLYSPTSIVFVMSLGRQLGNTVFR